MFKKNLSVGVLAASLLTCLTSPGMAESTWIGGKGKPVYVASVRVYLDSFVLVTFKGSHRAQTDPKYNFSPCGGQTPKSISEAAMEFNAIGANEAYTALLTAQVSGTRLIIQLRDCVDDHWQKIVTVGFGDTPWFYEEK